MAYRHHSLRCHHRVQNTQGSNEHQLRITCQGCQGHLAIVYGRHLNLESRRLIREHLDTTLEPQGPAQTPPVRERPQPLARAAAAIHEPQAEPQPAARQEDVEVNRARLILKLTELNQEIRRLTAELEALPRQETQPPQAQDLPEAQGSPRQHRPHP